MGLRICLKVLAGRALNRLEGRRCSPKTGAYIRTPSKGPSSACLLSTPPRSSIYQISVRKTSSAATAEPADLEGVSA
jgi:hypothetical protein